MMAVRVAAAVVIWCCTGCNMAEAVAATALPTTKRDSIPSPVSVNGSSVDLTTITDGHTPSLINFSANSKGQWAQDLVAFNTAMINLHFDFSTDVTMPPKSMVIDYFQCPPWGVAFTKLFTQETHELPVTGYAASPTATSSTTTTMAMSLATDCVGVARMLYDIAGLVPRESVHIKLDTTGWLYLAEVAFYTEEVDRLDIGGHAHLDETTRLVGITLPRTSPLETDHTQSKDRPYITTTPISPEDPGVNNPMSTSTGSSEDKTFANHNGGTYTKNSWPHSNSTHLLSPYRSESFTPTSASTDTSTSQTPCNQDKCNCHSTPVIAAATAAATMVMVSVATTVVHIAVCRYCHAHRKRQIAAAAIAGEQRPRETLMEKEDVREEETDMTDTISITTVDNQCYSETNFTQTCSFHNIAHGPLAPKENLADQVWHQREVERGEDKAERGEYKEEQLYESLKLPTDQFSMSLHMNSNDAYQRI